MDSLCRRCFTRIALRSRRPFATIAASQPPPPTLDGGIAAPPVDCPSEKHQRPASDYQLAASVVVSRPPILTRELTPFEKEFFFYQRRLDKRLVRPFVRGFYFKRGTLAFDEWRAKRKDMKVYDPYDRHTGWADELRYGDKPGDDEDMGYEELVKYTVSGEDISASDTEEEIAAKKTMTKPLPRETDADVAGDVRSLNRMLSRTLYLLVKRGDRADDVWKFPQANLEDKENLKQCAEGILTKACGRDMNYWMVGNVPIGHYSYARPDGADRQKEGQPLGKTVFFMKARVFAGRPRLAGNQVKLVDHQWLPKEEIEAVVAKDYWKAIKHMLVASPLPSDLFHLPSTTTTTTDDDDDDAREHQPPAVDGRRHLSDSTAYLPYLCIEPSI
ncbi:54S ribosomal protein L17 [Drechslerella dactyloides]|uniref:Large ribosomal subunit protein mL46 n=1 Tax=Drechslerella dactyloides TaxID=74499 RepID=A0AAD6J443_DREDA|nr:54S ribosomal protein L17 [Drechslerella dactyloides]